MLAPACLSQISVDSNKYKDVSVDIYLSQKGWHGVKDRLLVWMTTQQGAFTMLPKCTASVSKANVDALGLRAPSPVVDGDPSSVPEPYEWRTLRARLGAGSRTVSVCAALQTGAGAEALYVDNVALHEESTAARCSALPGDVLGFTKAASANACKGTSSSSPSTTAKAVTSMSVKPVVGVLRLCGFEDSEARDAVSFFLFLVF